MNNRLFDLMEQKKVLIFDGGMGTSLYEKGIFFNRCYDEVCCSSPQIVKDIHKEFIMAGSDIIETNSFGANRFKLKPYGYASRVVEINTCAVNAAKDAVHESQRTDILIAGSVGHLGVRIEPWGPVSLEEANDAFYEQIMALASAGVDLIVLETFYDLNEIKQAIFAAKKACDLPIIAHMTVNEDGLSLYGTEPKVFVSRLEEWGADVIGVNCSVGPKKMFEVLEKIISTTSKPVSVMPNAGVPISIEGRNFYLCSPEYFGEYARRYVQAGARFVGGCCGTTPRHIKEVRNYISSIIPRSIEIIAEKTEDELSQINITEVPIQERSKLAKKIADGEWVTMIEITPPRGCNPDGILKKCEIIKNAGIDAVNLPDGPRANARMGPLALSILINEKVGIEPVMHYCCRDRNLLGMQSDLLGASAAGINNILIITGDPPKMGNIPDATAVFDVDSIGLVNIVKRFNQGYDLGWNSIGQPTKFLIGVGVNPCAINLEEELKRFKYKVEAGAEFVITQPVFEEEQLLSFLEKIKDFRIPVIAGIWPLISYNNAEFMNNEVPGVKIPNEIMEKMRDAQSIGKEAALEEGVRIAKNTIEKIRPYINGVQVSAPLGKVEIALDVIR